MFRISKNKFANMSPWDGVRLFIILTVALSGFLLIQKEEAVMAKDSVIQLPKPSVKGKCSLEEAIAKRRSQRSFLEKDLNLEQIGQLLWAAQGITARRGPDSFRAAPSAGALYPMEVYLAAKDGFYHYLPEGHQLEVVGQKDLRGALSEAAYGQECVAQAPIDIVICAVYSRVTVKYGERGPKLAHIEAGHIAQNIHLQAVALGLGSVPVGGFSDKAAKKVISLGEDCDPVYIIPVGYPS